MLLDCTANLLLLGSFDETLSARAHRMRLKNQPYFWWTADAIDALFRLFGQRDHCARQLRQEEDAGGAWAALFA
jgi:hypothetical protein